MLLNLFAFVILLPSISGLLDPAFNDDALGLIVFKAGLEDPNGNLLSWNEEDDTPCNWTGIKCDMTTNRVSEINLTGFSLSGHIDRGILRLQSLKVLLLAKNNFTGTINPNLCRLGGLRVVDLSENNLSGSIPDEFFAECKLLRAVSLAKNALTGTIPSSLSSCLTLITVNFSSNQLSGSLPLGIWSLFGLRLLDFSDNLLEGEIPVGIQNAYNLRWINLRKNKFFGNFPEKIGECLLLKFIDFGENSFSGILPDSIGKLNKCSSLSLQRNFFMGSVHDSIGEMKNLEKLDLSSNQFSNEIPISLGNLISLKELNLSSNQFTGNLPDSMKSCFNLSSIDVSQNLLTGDLPPWIFESSFHSVSFSENRIGEKIISMNSPHQSFRLLDFSSNKFSGEIPSGIGNLSSLQVLNVSSNFLFGSITEKIGDLKSINVIDLSRNWLNGSIPYEIGGADSLLELRLDQNFLSGKIPSEIGKCSSLITLILSKNNLTGPIPVTIANLTNIQTIDVSSNNLSGTLPKDLTNLSHLISFNISHNHLEGELPVGGFFDHIPASSLFANPSLCGSVLNQSCPSVHPKPIVLNPNSSSGGPNDVPFGSTSPHQIILSVSSLIAIGAAVLIAIGVVTVTLLNIHVRAAMERSSIDRTVSYGKDEFSSSPTTTDDPNYGKLVMFSNGVEFFDDAHGLLNKECEIGRGGFGVVYRTILKDGRSIAIKKLTTASLMKSREDFEIEVKRFGKIKHRNLVGFDGFYWTPSLQLLITEYVSNGNLFTHLHENLDQNCLSWRERFNIVTGIAKGLAHLHELGVIHYNLKSTNVLIDNSGEAKIGDFGLANLLPKLDPYVLSGKVQSALGYTAPEFACRSVKVTEKCDVYGFGILVLEVVTGRKPVEYMEDDVVVLCDMVRRALEDGRPEECIDERIQGSFPAEEAVSVIKLGLICASQVPSNRPEMSEVVNILEVIQCPSEVV